MLRVYGGGGVFKIEMKIRAFITRVGCSGAGAHSRPKTQIQERPCTNRNFDKLSNVVTGAAGYLKPSGKLPMRSCSSMYCGNGAAVRACWCQKQPHCINCNNNPEA